jgi:LysM repeat protein
MEPRLNRLLFGIVLLFFMAGYGFSEEIVHVIKKGDTIYSIARTYGTSFQEIMSYNKINDERTIQIGAKIRIPGTVTINNPTKQAYGEYKVEKNDTLYALARRYDIPLAELLDLNGFAPDYVLKAGEKIRVPASGSSQSSGYNSTSQPSIGNSVPTVTIKVDPSVKWPIKAKEISQITGKLNGVQLTGERQEGVKSLTGGTVVSAGPYRGFGRVAIIQTTNGYLYVYGGCETLSVKEGDKVSAGTELGKLGIDTKTAKSQLFFFVYKGNNPVDPMKAPRA